MVEIGTIKLAHEIDKKSGRGSGKYYWAACPDCGKERWAQFRGSFQSVRCKSCQSKKSKHYKCGDKSPFWKGGRHTSKEGYVSILIPYDDFFSPMINRDGYVMEHRLVMAKSLGRNLHSWEIVHHKNHIKADNQIENLQLVSDDRHRQITILENKIRRLETRVTQLEADNVRLRLEGKE